MNWREQIRNWSLWPGWRRHAPAAGSLVVHAVLVVAVAGMLAAASPEVQTAQTPPDRFMTIELAPNLAIPAGVTPPPRAMPEKAPERKPAASPPIRPPEASSRPAPEATDPGDEDVFYLPPSVLIPSDAPPGLRSLMGQDPCEATFGPKARECAGRDLAKGRAPVDSVVARAGDQLAQDFAAFQPVCTLRVGCDGGEWISTNGTRSTGRPPPGSPNDRGAGTPGAGGAASLGGLHDSVGRLGFNPDHRDPGFGD